MKKILVLFVAVLVLTSCENERKTKTVTEKLTQLEQQIAQNPDDFNAYAERAAIYLEQGKLDPAFKDVNKSITLKPDNSAAYVILSDIYFVLGNKDNSISALKKAASLDLKDPLPLVKLAEIYLMTKEYEKADLYADRAISLNADLAKPYYLKGISLLENNDTANALINLKVASNLDTNNFAANMQIAVIYQSKEDSLSEIYLKRALKIDPENSSALYYLAMNYQSNSRYNEALSVYSQMFDNEKSAKRAYYNSGYIYLVEKQNYDSAILMFKEAVNIDKQFVEGVFNLGRAYEANSQFELARKYYDSAIILLPNYPLAVQGLNRLDNK